MNNKQGSESINIIIGIDVRARPTRKSDLKFFSARIDKHID